jgi:stage V sporulation protein SpoVS
MQDETRSNRQAERGLDSLLRHSYPPGPTLSRDFDAKVMSALARDRRVRNRRFVLITMTAYWAFASLCGALVLSGVSSADVQAGGHAAVITAVLALVVATALFMVRQSGFRLSELFFRTIR